MNYKGEELVTRTSEQDQMSREQDPKWPNYEGTLDSIQSEKTGDDH
jgi:hypothetical protein